MILSTIIITYNSEDYLNKCLSSYVKKTRGLKSEIIVIDNASRDRTLQIVRKYPLVKLIKNKTNRYYAAACNQGLKIATGDYILLLNPDTIIINRAIQKMINFLKENSECAVVGPKTFDVFGRPIISAYPPINLLDVLQEGNLTYAISPERPILSKLVYRHKFRNLCFYGQNPQSVGWVSGAALMIKKDAAKFLGPKDERFFSYAEEADWLWKLNQKKSKVFYLPGAEIVHIGATTAKQNWQALSHRIKSSYYNRIEFCEKYFPKWIFLLEFIIAWELILKIIYRLSFTRLSFTWSKDERKARLKTYYDLIRWNSLKK